MNPLNLLTYKGNSFERISHYFTYFIIIFASVLIPFGVVKAQEISPEMRKAADPGNITGTNTSASSAQTDHRLPSSVPKSSKGIFILNPVADAYVRSGNNANINFGNFPDLVTRNTTLIKGIYYAYLKFDISSVNNFSSVKLRLYGRADKNISASVNVLSVPSETWKENIISWNNKPGEQNAILASANISGTTAQYYEWDLTQHISNLRNSGATSVSLMLKNSNATTGLIHFNSVENPTNKPELQITGSGSSTAVITRSDIENSLAFSIYPNPTSNYLQLRHSPEFNTHKLQVMDMNGRSIKTIVLTGTTTQTISVYDLKEGTYLLNIEINHKRYTQRVVIRK
jgi:hypothetical protein